MAIAVEETYTEARAVVPLRSQSGISFYLSSILFAAPLVCFGGALISDWAYVRNPDIQWSNFSAWLLAFGMFFICVSMFFGIIGFLINFSRGRRASWLYGLFLLAAAGVALLDNFIHSHDGWTSVWPSGIILSAVTVALLVIAMVLKISALSGTYVVDGK